MKKNIVEKSNTLNMFISNTNDAMTLNELRFFYMYLSKLNARNPDKRTAEISVDEFERLFGVELNTTEFTAKIQKICTPSLLMKKEIFINVHLVSCVMHILMNILKEDSGRNSKKQTVNFILCSSHLANLVITLYHQRDLTL